MVAVSIGGAQSRAAINEIVAAGYADAKENDALLQLITDFYDGSVYWLADGFHRVRASMYIGALSIEAEVRTGDQRDARLFSAGANGEHGVQRTNEDKRRAVLTLLEDTEWRDWSDREIAKRCHVAHSMVTRTRRSLDSESSEKPAVPGDRRAAPRDSTDRRQETRRASDQDDENSSLESIPVSAASQQHLETFPDRPPEQTKNVARGGKKYEMRTSGISGSNKARAKKAPPAETPADAPPEDPLPVDDREGVEFTAQMLADYKATLDEAIKLRAIIDSDKIAASLWAENVQLMTQNAALRTSGQGLQNEKDEAVRAAKAAIRRAERAEKALKEQGK